MKYGQKLTRVEELRTVIKRFHLIGAPMPKSQNTIPDIKAIKPDYVVPMHCAGFEAIMTFAREMPEQFILNTAGTRYIFTA